MLLKKTFRVLLPGRFDFDGRGNDKILQVSSPINVLYKSNSRADCLRNFYQAAVLTWMAAGIFVFLSKGVCRLGERCVGDTNICMYTYIYTCICICLYMYVYKFVNVYMCIYICTYVYVYIYL